MSKFGFGSLQSKIAHTSTIPALGNKDLRALQEWITAEKAVLTSLERLAGDWYKAGELLKAWGAGEGDDLKDVLYYSSEMLDHVSAGLSRFAAHESSIRGYLKNIRAREENLDDMRKRRRALMTRAEAAQKKLSKMGQENKGLAAQTDLLTNLRNEIQHLDSLLFVEEAGILDFKRRSAKDILHLKFGGLFELAEKATIVGDLGKLLIEEVPMEPRIPGQPPRLYNGYDRTRGLAEEASLCIKKVEFEPTSSESMVPAQESGHSAAPPPPVPVTQFQQPYQQPYQLPSPTTTRSPLGFGVSASPWAPTPSHPQYQTTPSPASDAQGRFEQPHPMPDRTSYNEFGQASSSPVNRQLPSTFPIAASHMRDGAFSTGGAETISGRPSYLEQTAPQGPQVAPQVRQTAPQVAQTAPQDHVRFAMPDSHPTRENDTVAQLPTGAAQPAIPSASPWHWQPPTRTQAPEQFSTQKQGQPGDDFSNPPSAASDARAAVRRGRSGDDFNYPYDNNVLWVRTHGDSSGPIDNDETRVPSLPHTPEFESKDMPSTAHDDTASSVHPPRVSTEFDASDRALLPPHRPKVEESPPSSIRSNRSATRPVPHGSPAEAPTMGTRTISAAAFRRGQSRSPGDRDTPPETPPLQFRKKHSNRTLATDFASSPTASPSDNRGALTPYPEYLQTTNTLTNPVPLHSAPQEVSTPQSAMESAEEDWQAHQQPMDTLAGQRQAQDTVALPNDSGYHPAPPSSSGYAEGRFSTSLE